MWVPLGMLGAARAIRGPASRVKQQKTPPHIPKAKQGSRKCCGGGSEGVVLFYTVTYAPDQLEWADVLYS